MAINESIGPRPQPSPKLSIGGWVIVSVLMAMATAAVMLAYAGWSLGSAVDVPPSGYAALIIGVVFSLLVGCGLMALVFYSSRKGYDEAPVLLKSERDGTDGINTRRAGPASKD